ncbi:MAG: hypothetical protein JW789_01680 [Candidatus Aenigmarchaeota archaeon]|nr:hypothetical protein [Candidatus Aenigmarchaeota archaeon]
MGDKKEKKKPVEKAVKEKNEDVQKRLESKVLGMLEDSDRIPNEKPEDSPLEKKSDETKTEEKEDEAPSGEEKEEVPSESPPSDAGKQTEKSSEDNAKPVGKPKDKKKADTPEENIEELIAHREEIEALLSSVEDSYRDATIPDNTYHEVKDKNEKRLEEINKKIAKLEETVTPEQKKKIEESMKKQEEEKEEKSIEVTSPSTPPEAGPSPKNAVQETDAALGRREATAKFLEEKIEEKLRDVIAAASVEVTDKRLKKLEGRLDPIEMTMKNIENDTQTVTTSVGSYDKQFTMMKTEVEKLKAVIDGVKESRNVIDEKIQRTTETFAEVRSAVYQMEAWSKEQETIIAKLKDSVSQIDTARVLREFTSRDQQMRDVNTRVERLERTTKMMNDSMNRIKGLMTDIGSLENIVKASKHVGEKLEKIQEIEERIKANSSRLDSVYLDMKKKIDEFNEYKVKQDKLTGMTEDLMKNVGEMTRRLADYATKSDITGVKDQIGIVRELAKKASAAPAQPAVSPEVRRLTEEKEEITALMDTIEENYRSKSMSEADYNNTKDKNIQKIKAIDQKIAAAQKISGTRISEDSGDGKHTKVMLLAKFRESYENGEISKKAYDESRRMLLRK